MKHTLVLFVWILPFLLPSCGMGGFVEYLKRCNFLLQQGRYVADAAYFIGEDAPKMTGVTDPPVPEGYSFDYYQCRCPPPPRTGAGRSGLPSRLHLFGGGASALYPPHPGKRRGNLFRVQPGGPPCTAAPFLPREPRPEGGIMGSAYRTDLGLGRRGPVPGPTTVLSRRRMPCSLPASWAP